MGWISKDDSYGRHTSSSADGDVSEYRSPNPSSPCSTRKVVNNQCRTEEVEPGKFIRKCEKTEEILRNCVGRPVEVVESNREYTEDDVTDQVLKEDLSMGSDQGAFDFPGLRSDIDTIERNFIQGLGRFFEAAEVFKNDIFNSFGLPHVFDGGSLSSPHVFDGGSSSSPASRNRAVPFKNQPHQEASPKQNDSDSGHIDLSELARDV